MKLTFVLGLFLCISFFSEAKFDSTIYINDFNNDSFVDTVTEYHYYYTQFFKIRDGKSNNDYRLGGIDDGQLKGHYYEVSLIPNFFMEEKNSGYIAFILKKICKNNIIEPSFFWMKNIIEYHQLKTPEFDKQIVYNLKPKWYKDSLVAHKSVTLVKVDTVKHLFEKYYWKESYKDITHGFLIYYGHNHYQTWKIHNKSYKIGKSTLYCTGHGVIQKKGGKFRWLMISVDEITTISSKLRFSSIIKIIPYKKNYIILKQAGYIRNFELYTLINLKNGHFVSLHSPAKYNEKIEVEEEYIKKGILFLEYDNYKEGEGTDTYDLKKFIRLIR